MARHWAGRQRRLQIEGVKVRPIRTKNKELLPLSMVLIVSIVLALLSVSISLTDRFYGFIEEYTYLPVGEFIIGGFFLALIGLLWLTYRRWRAADARQEELENIVDSINPDVLLVVDPDRNVVMCNPSVKRMFGYDVAEVVNQKTSMLYFDRRSKPDQPHEIFEALEKEGFHVGLATGKKKNSEELPLEIITGNLRCRGGAVLLLRDIRHRNRVEQELKQSIEKLRRLLEEIVNVLASTAEMRDPYTAGHQRRVTVLACAIAEEMGLSEEQIEGIRLAALIHDIGKIYVPAEILSKPGRLTETEFSLIKAHPEVGHDALKSIEFPWPVAQIVLQHHERMDGSGFPQGLSEGEILLEARVLAVADVVEAMSSHRPYRPAHGIEKALEEISERKGVLYDSRVVDACLKLFTEKEFKLT
jgi:PAS domain S-box-containing protein/putative nucleotidyltransferase with HDIG domain